MWLIALWAACAHADSSGVDWREHVTLSVSERVRGELVDWFAPDEAVRRGLARGGAERYAFFASRLRGGLRLLYAPFELVVDVQDTRLAGLPGDAVVGPLTLGPGASYVQSSHDTTQGETVLKQAHLTVRTAGLTATFGRFEYRDGLETLPADGTLSAVKRSRIAERLVGSFDFTHVTRSVNGARVAYDRPEWNVTAFAARPTAGGFEISANRDLDDIGLTGLALGVKRWPFAPPFDGRLFYLYYDDQRRQTTKTDNRAGERLRDHERLAIHTIGAHALTAIDAGPGTIDLLLWAAAQTGRWGVQRHDAYAYALEAGYQLPRAPWAPWLRVGIDRSSGDDTPSDDRHQTFFQLLPTARTYAPFPFYNLMNTQDVLAELLLRPHAKLSLKLEYHWLQLSSRRDLWYAGSGAGNPDSFGFSGISGGGRRDLAHVASLAVGVEVLPQVSLGGFYGHAFGGGVVGAAFQDRAADYGFVEATFRY